MIALFIAAVTFVVDPADPDLKFDGYKVVRNGDEYTVVCARERSKLYAEYDRHLWEKAKSYPFVRNPAFKTRFLNPGDCHSIKEWVAATGCNLIQLGRLGTATLEDSMPEVFAQLDEKTQAEMRERKRMSAKSAAVRVKECTEADVPAYPLLYGCDASKWNKTLCEAFLRAHPSARALDPGRSWEKGILCPSDPATRKFIESYVAEIASLAPYEGIVATFWDDYGLNCHCKRCRRNGNSKFSNQVAFAVGCYERACKAAGKKLIVRTWSSGAPHWLGDEWVHAPGYGGIGGEPMELWGKTYENLSHETIIQTKVYNCDCQPNAPFSLLLGKVREATKGRNREFAEWQITGQTLGRQYFPASFVNHTKWTMVKAFDLVGAEGGVALYAGGYKNGGYDALADIMNSVNIYAWRELSWNPEKDVDSIWREWAEPIYGHKAASAIIAAIKESEFAAAVAFSPLGLGAPTESNLPNNAARREDLLRYTNRHHLPEGQAVLAPTRENIKKVVAEKDEAIASVKLMETQFAAAEIDTGLREELILRTRWLKEFLYCTKALDGALWRLHYVRALADRCIADRTAIDEIAADFNLVRAHHKELFKVSPSMKLSFWKDPVGEREISLNSPVPLMRDIENQAKAAVERVSGP